MQEINLRDSENILNHVIIPDLNKIKETFNQQINRWGVKMKKEETQLFTNKFKE